jgi:ATP-dependent DNA helicase RecQ
VAQLGLKNPAVLVGNFDRPNLTYRVLPAMDHSRQVLEVLDRHKGEAGIIYCLRRRDVDELTDFLRKNAYQAMPYHAGMEPENRHASQTAFAEEKCNLIVATIAFGMGIDRSNIRFILHASMPKSIEHYQQETGRAGRDGLEAECVMLYSGADLMTWKYILGKSAEEPGVDPSFLPNAQRHLEDMNRFCQGSVCRHRALVEYFGQKYGQETCQACDLCLGDAEPVSDSLVLAQKILSCVARVKENFGVKHVVDVLRGRESDKARQHGHEKLSTFGLLRDCDEKQLRDWIHQLVGQGALMQTADEYPVLKLTPASWEVMKGQRPARLLQRVQRQETRRSKADTVSWEGVDRPLFEALRELRKRLADERAVPPYVIFSDATLRELARMRPSSLERMWLVYGIGDAKLEEFGGAFLRLIQDFCHKNRLAVDQPASPARWPDPKPPPVKLNPMRDLAFRLFAEQADVVDVVHQTGRSRSTIMGYLCDFIRDTKPPSIAAWVKPDLYEEIAAAARQSGMDRLKPIFEALDGRVEYDDIRLVVTHLNCQSQPNRY